MKTIKSLTRSQCQHALLNLDNSLGTASSIYKFTVDKYFWNEYNKFTSSKFIDLLYRLHDNGRWQNDFEKNIFNEYLRKLNSYNF